jgi:nitrogen fixation protein NifU and related proteins
MQYTDKVMEHFENPQNVGTLENADGKARVGDPSCGDFINVWIKVQNETIVDFKYKVYGCGAAIATSSAVSVLAIGKTFSEALELTDDDVVKYLGGLPQGKQHCSLLGVQGLYAAMADYLIKKNHDRYQARLQALKDMGFDIHKEIEKILSLYDYEQSEINVLDVASFEGLSSIHLALDGVGTTFIDPDSTLHHQGQLNAVNFHVDETIAFEPFSWSFQDNEFDLILCFAALHRFQHPNDILSEMNRTIKKGGVILLADFNLNGKRIFSTVEGHRKRNVSYNDWTIDTVVQWLQDKKFVINRQMHNGLESIMAIAKKE